MKRESKEIPDQAREMSFLSPSESQWKTEVKEKAVVSPHKLSGFQMSSLCRDIIGEL